MATLPNVMRHPYQWACPSCGTSVSSLVPCAIDPIRLAEAIHGPHEPLIRAQASPRRQAVRSRKCREADLKQAVQIAHDYVLQGGGSQTWENAELLRRLDQWQDGDEPGPLIRWAAAHLRGEQS
jgi:hypothetical protein